MMTPTLRKMKRQTFSMVEGRERKKEMSVSCSRTGSANAEGGLYVPWGERTMFLRSRTSVTAMETTSSSRSLPMI